MPANIRVELLPDIREEHAGNTFVCLCLPVEKSLGQFFHQTRGIASAAIFGVAVYAGDTVGDTLCHVSVGITDQRAFTK